jgi:uncharacterized protein
VNLNVPSELRWVVKDTPVIVSQRTAYPGTEETQLSISADTPVTFVLKIRVPSWCANPVIAVSGESRTFSGSPNEWITINRTWHDDKVTLRFPMKARAVPVDSHHPNRIAVMFGPLLMVQDARYTLPIRGDQTSIVSRLTKVSDRPELKLGTDSSSAQSTNGPRKDIGTANGEEVGRYIPFYVVPERDPYRAYIDMDRKTFF